MQRLTRPRPSEAIIATLTPAALAGLDDRQLRQVIDANLFPGREQTPSIWDALLDPDVLERTRAVLSDGLVHINGELGARRNDLEAFRHQCWQQGAAGRDAWFQAEHDFNDWHARASRVKRAFERRVQQGKAAARAGGTQKVADERRRYREACRLLAVAIDQHRQTSMNQGFEETDHDRALWDALREVRVPFGADNDVAAADLLADGIWY